MPLRSLLRCCVALLLSAAALLAAHRGQVKFGGLPLPGATVTASSGGRKSATVTDPQGGYVFPDLPDGSWTIRVEMLCFEAAQREVAVAPDAPSTEWEMKLLPVDRMNATAVVGGYQKTEVAATPPPVPAKRSDDVAPPPSTETAAELNQRAADGFLINGTTNNAASSPFSLANAFGNSRKGAGSLYNGNIGFVLDNSGLDARPFSLTGQDTPKSAYNHLTGLLSFGGPIKIPRVLRNGPNFLVNYQWTRDRTAFTQSGRMPTLAERAGDGVPLSRISPQALALLSFYPLPNFDGGSRYNYQTSLVGANHQDSLQTRMNKTVGRKNQFSGNFALQSIRGTSQNLFGFQDATRSLGINTGVNWRHFLTTHLSTNVGYQFSRFRARVNPFFANRANVSGAAGISGNNQDPINWGPPSLSFASGITPLTDATASLTRNQTSAVSTAVIWNRGRHNVTAGGDLRRQQFNLLSQQNPRGSFTFTGAAAGSDFAGFLEGIPDTSSIAFGNADKYLRAWANDAYVADDWRISPGLTVNLGIRWEYGSPMSELYGRLVNLALSPDFTTAAPLIARGSRSLLRPDQHGFQPRLAVSWRPLPASSLVIRAGYGVYYNTSVYQSIATQMAQQPPLSRTLSVQNTPANPLTLASGFNAPPGATLNTFAVDPNFRVGYAHNWQASMQRDLPRGMVVLATYNGIKGTREVQSFLPNTYPAGALNPCPDCPAGFSYLTSNGNSTRESGQIQLRRRLQAGLTASLQYTYSKSIDDAALGGRGQGAAVIAQNWLDLSAERGLSNFDQRHQVTVQAQYTSGMGIGGGALAGGRVAALLKEWTLTSQITAGSGLPLTPIYLAAVAGTGVTGSIRPDYTGASLYAAPGGLFLNPAAYVAPAVGHWGNAGRNSITGPPQLTMIASLGRTFRFADRYSVDLRVDSSNPINHVTYAAWNTTVTNAQFGLATAANAMRSLQTTLRVRF